LLKIIERLPIGLTASAAQTFVAADEDYDVYDDDTEVELYKAYFRVEVDRTSPTFLDDLFRHYLTVPKEHLLLTPLVTFTGEAGVDGGALSRDYFYVVFTALINDRLRSRCLFDGVQGHLLPSIDHRLLDARAYWFLGVLLAQVCRKSILLQQFISSKIEIC